MEDNHFKITTNSKLFALGIEISEGVNPDLVNSDGVNVSKTDTLSVKLDNANKNECDIIALYFNIEKFDDIENSTQLLKSILPQISKPLMICGCGKDDLDKYLLPELIKTLDRECIMSYAEESSYKNIIPEIIKGNHYIVLKTPIDINLAKELNILSTDLGLDKNKIIMNTDIGGLGYSYEYGYSIMEKVRLEGKKGDDYLSLPLLSEAARESLKTKEAKSETITAKGSINTRAKMIELSASAGVLSAGANIIVMFYPENISIMKGLI